MRDMWEGIKINPIGHDTHILKKKTLAGSLSGGTFHLQGSNCWVIVLSSK